MENTSDTMGKVVYEISDISELLGMKRSSTYNFIRKAYKEQSPFRVLKINGIYRIPKAGFDSWINGQESM